MKKMFGLHPIDGLGSSAFPGWTIGQMPPVLPQISKSQRSLGLWRVCQETQQTSSHTHAKPADEQGRHPLYTYNLKIKPGSSPRLAFTRPSGFLRRPDRTF
jgi:hypothetical protein